MIMMYGYVREGTFILVYSGSHLRRQIWLHSDTLLFGKWSVSKLSTIAFIFFKGHRYKLKLFSYRHNSLQSKDHHSHKQYTNHQDFRSHTEGHNLNTSTHYSSFFITQSCTCTNIVTGFSIRNSRTFPLIMYKNLSDEDGF